MAVISQILLRRADGKGRVAIHDIMINTPSIAALIRDNKTFRIPSDMQTGAKYGMITMDDNMYQKFTKGIVSREDCINKAQDYLGMLQKLKEYDEVQSLEGEEDAAPPAKQH